MHIQSQGAHAPQNFFKWILRPFQTFSLLNPTTPNFIHNIKAYTDLPTPLYKNAKKFHWPHFELNAGVYAGLVLSYLVKNAKLNVDSLLTKDLLLCSWSVPSWSSSPAECWHCTDLRAQCQVCSCVYLTRPDNEKHAKIYRYGVLCHFAKHTVSIKAGSWPAKKLNCCQIHSFDATKMVCTKK